MLVEHMTDAIGAGPTFSPAVPEQSNRSFTLPPLSSNTMAANSTRSGAGHGLGHDQEKLEMATTVEHRPHRGSPSQKTALPRWRIKGKEKSSVALACTWVVDHQIGREALAEGCSDETGSPMCQASPST